MRLKAFWCTIAAAVSPSDMALWRATIMPGQRLPPRFASNTPNNFQVRWRSQKADFVLRRAYTRPMWALGTCGRAQHNQRGLPMRSVLFGLFHCTLLAAAGDAPFGSKLQRGNLHPKTQATRRLVIIRALSWFPSFAVVRFTPHARPWVWACWLTFLDALGPRRVRRSTRHRGPPAIGADTGAQGVQGARV